MRLQVLYMFVLRTEKVIIYKICIMQLHTKSKTFHGYIFRILQHFASKLCNFTDFNMHFVTVVKDVPRLKFSLLWVSVKNGNRNERSRNGNDRNRKRPPNFPHKSSKMRIYAGN